MFPTGGLWSKGTAMGLLDGQVVIITGGGGEVGSAEAQLFAAEGAKLVVNDLGTGPDGAGRSPAAARKVVDGIVATGGQAVASTADISCSEGAGALVATAVERFGRVDALVNNAGIAIDAPLLSLTEAAWDRVLATHAKGSWLCTQRVAQQMIEQGGGGRVVMTTSVAGLYGARGQANYVAAKAAVYGLTRAAAIELEPHGITVNAIAPVARTRLTHQQPQLQGLEPLTADHVAPAALFFASGLCGDRSGEVLAVAGGRMYRLRVVETKGAFKDAQRPWTAQEIEEHWDGLSKG